MRPKNKCTAFDGCNYQCAGDYRYLEDRRAYECDLCGHILTDEQIHQTRWSSPSFSFGMNVIKSDWKITNITGI